MAADHYLWILYETEYGTAPDNRGYTHSYGSDYTITEADLPEITDDSGECVFIGWTLDGSTILHAGDILSYNDADNSTRETIFTLIAVWQAKQFKRPYLDKTGLSHFLSGLWQKITAKVTAETDRATAAEEALDAKIVQADWNENDETSMAYIINKPDFVAITTAEIDEICVDFTLDEASAILTEIDEVIGG